MKKKFPYNIKKSLTRILPLGALMAIATNCTKEPQPNPNPNPGSTVTPTKVDTIYWNWSANMGWAPPMDTVKYHVANDDVKWVVIHLHGRDGPHMPHNCVGYYPGSFHEARDSLQTRIDIAPNIVKLSGFFYINTPNLPNHQPGQGTGIAGYDREWFERMGCIFFYPSNSR